MSESEGHVTIKLDAVQVLSELIRGVSAEVKAAREETTTRFDAIDVQIEGLKGAEKNLATAVNELDADLKDVRARQRSTDEDIRRLSERTKDTAVSVSHGDLEGASQLAQERALRGELAAKVDALDVKIDTKTDAQTAAIIARFDSVVKNPYVMKTLYVIGGAILSWLAAKGHVIP